ncbi:MAG: YibE/F family protein [Rikenellaceae bacterium]
MQRRELYFILVVAVATLALYLLPTGFENREALRDIAYAKSEVVAADDSDLTSISIVTMGTQLVELRLLSGSHKGEVVEARNELLGDTRRDKIFAVGDRVLCRMRVGSDGAVVDSVAEEFYRADLSLLLLVGFVVLLIVVAGRTGAKSALSFLFTALAFAKLLLPGVLRGYSPLLLSVGVVFATTSVITLLVGGVTRRGFVALAGAMIGVATTAAMALLFGSLFHIPSTVMEYSETLLYAGFVDLNLSEIFISCIFISSAGAVMDVAMDIAAAQDEIVDRAPNLSCGELIRSGLNIASPVVGSMTTTLLFAYSGSYMFAFMLFMSQGAPLESIVNRGFVAAEILHTMVGSFGLVLVAPITAIVGGVVYRARV